MLGSTIEFVVACEVSPRWGVSQCVIFVEFERIK